MMQRICLKKSKIPCFERCKFLHPRGGFYFPSPPFRGRLRGGFDFPSPPFRGRLRGGFLQVVTPPHPSPERGGNSKVEILQGLHPRRAVQKDIPPLKGEENFFPLLSGGDRGEVSSLETPPQPSPERGGDSKVEILQGVHPRRAVQKDIPPLKGEEIKK
jgi:hypothetical protein